MVYKIALFFHVCGALMLSAAIVVEWMTILNMRKVNSYESLKLSLKNYSRLSKIGGIAIALIILPGGYMMATVWHGAGWIIAGFFGLVAMALTGGLITGRKMRTIGKISAKENQITPEMQSILKKKSFLVSIRTRTFLFLGIIFIMTIKTDLSVSSIILIFSYLLGVIPVYRKRDLQETKIAAFNENG